MAKGVFRTVAVALVLASAVTVSAYAQNIFGSIIGTVVDQSGAVLPKAAVTITNIATGDKRAVTSDASGNYQALSLPRGEYTIDIESSGFKHYSRSPIDVVVDQVARVDVAMTIGEQTQTVNVTGAPPIMQTDSASLGQAIEGTAVRDLPLNGRNILALVALVPGVVPQGASNTNLSGQNVFAAGNFQIGGGNSNQGSVLVDGVSTNTSYGNAVELVMDQDSIQEFNVQTHNNTAEFGKYTGGVINMSTKSGTNAFHGTGYEYVRNTIFNANTFFAKRNNSGKQNWHQNQFGGNIGGPVWKNKLFFFGDYQGYRQTNGQLVLVTVPTTAELTGDFSAISAKLYDPLTTCGTLGNPACTPQQISGAIPTRQQFSYNGTPNIIPPNRLSTVAKNLINFPIYAQPNVPGGASPEGPTNNFSRLSTAGGTNDQYTIRGDQNLSAKQTMFERYTAWSSKNIDPKPFPNNNLYYIALAPEVFTTKQIVFGDTYVLNSKSVVDLRLGYLRWNYNRIPTNIGLNEATAFGWPSYMNFGALNNLPKSTAVPMMSTGGPISYYEGSAGYIFSINNNYSIASTYQRIWNRHTFKVGIDLRRLEMNYFQNNNPGGIFTFDNLFTAQSAANPGSGSTVTGNPLASFELGYVSSNTAQTVQVAPPTYQTVYYQGYFAQDTWQVTNKLTATIGIRYEVPGTFRSRRGWADTFNPTEINSVVNLPGAYDLVSSAQHPAAGVYNENWNDWAPRVGVAYRLNDNTVIRAAFGKFFVPADLQFPSAPLQAGVNFLNNLMINTKDGQQTPFNTLDNPYPNGLLSPPHRNANYQQVLLGGNAQALSANEPNGYTYQWNLSVERQFWKGIALTASYAGLRGEHLPISIPINPLPDSLVAQAAADPTCATAADISTCFLVKQQPNPYQAQVLQGPLSQPTVAGNQLLRPFPQYGSISNSGHYVGLSNYHSLEVKLQKRMAGGGQLLGSYTFSKLLTNSEYLTSWLDATGTAGYSDYNNLGGEYANSSFDARQRLVVSYQYPLPIGKGQHFLANLSGVGNAVLGGWGLEGITTFQKGLPLGLTNSNNPLSTYAFLGSMRPMYIPSATGCNGTKTTSGAMYDRLGGTAAKTTYFNTNCFVQQSVSNPYVYNRFLYGNESRTDNTLRGPGQANWDMSLYKDFPIHESASFNLRVEAFNVFNRTQFGNPNLSVGNALFGQITSQLNNPRALQLSGRVVF